MALRKRCRREDTCAAAPETRTLPADLLLEIAARSAPHVFIRFAATSKLLCRELLAPSFIRRVHHPCILVYLNNNNKSWFTLIHPVTTIVASTCTDHLFPFALRHAPHKYSVKTSRRGLVLLQRYDCTNGRGSSEMCVYDPMSGAKTFFSRPRLNEIGSIMTGHQYIMLTAADGIGVDGSFLLLVADFNNQSIKLRIASSRRSKWRLVMSNEDFPWFSVKMRCNPAVLYGGVILWLVSHKKPILSYDLRRRKLGSVKLPPTNCKLEQLHLATSCDGKLLKLLAIDGFMMSVWLQLPISETTTGGSGWSLCTVIDMEEKVRSLRSDIDPNDLEKPIKFDDSQERSGNVVFLSVSGLNHDDMYYTVIVFNLETKDMHKENCGSALLEIDLPSRVRVHSTGVTQRCSRPKRIVQPNRRYVGTEWAK